MIRYTIATGKSEQQGTQPMARTVLTKLLSRLGERAGVKGVYPHRSRHPFAITFLRNELVRR